MTRYRFENKAHVFACLLVWCTRAARCGARVTRRVRTDLLHRGAVVAMDSRECMFGRCAVARVLCGRMCTTVAAAAPEVVTLRPDLGQFIYDFG